MFYFFHILSTKYPNVLVTCALTFQKKVPTFKGRGGSMQMIRTKPYTFVDSVTVGEAPTV
jgi:hypothetical protein